MEIHRTAPRTIRGDLAVGFLLTVGIVTGTAFLYGLLVDVRVVSLAMPAYSFETAFLALPAVGLLVAGVWLHLSDLEDAAIWLVGQFAVLGTLSATVVVVSLLATVSLTGVDRSGLFLLLVGTAGEGALLGVLVGIASAARTRTGVANEARDRLLVLHRLLQHNVRNRLNVISGYAHLLEDEEGHARMVVQQVDALTTLLDETRQAVETAADPPAPVPIGLSSMLDECVAVTRSTYPEAAISTNYPDDVTVLATDVVAPAFENVLDNAVSHSDRDDPTVRISTTRRGDTVVVDVADDGPGITDDRKESVFEPTTGGGHGLGLYLARELIELSGGEIWIETNEPRGTIVRISFSLAQTGSNRYPSQS